MSVEVPHWSVVVQSLQVTAVVGAFGFDRAFVRGRIDRNLAHALWTLVLLKMRHKPPVWTVSGEPVSLESYEVCRATRATRATPDFVQLPFTATDASKPAEA